MQLENRFFAVRAKHVSVPELRIATLTSFIRTSYVEQHVFKYRGVLYHLYYIIVTPVVVALWRDEYLIICTKPGSCTNDMIFSLLPSRH